MIVCPGCSNESADDAVFCGFCGTKLKDDQPKKTLFAFAAIPAKKPEAEPKPASAAREASASDAAASQAADTIADLDDMAKAALQGAAGGETVDSSADSSVDSGWGLDLDFGDTSTGMPAVTGPNEAVKPREDGAPEPSSPMVTRETPSVAPAALALAKAPSDDPASTAPSDPGPADTAPPGPSKSAKSDASDALASIGEAVLKSGVKHNVVGGPSVVAEGAEAAGAAAAKARKAAQSRKPKAKETTVLPRSENGDILAPGAQKVVPAPKVAPNASKRDEEDFFGASLSQYGMAGISKEELESQGYSVSDQEVAAELKQAKKRSFGMMVVALLVFGLLIGAIAALMILG